MDDNNQARVNLALALLNHRAWTTDTIEQVRLALLGATTSELLAIDEMRRDL